VVWIERNRAPCLLLIVNLGLVDACAPPPRPPPSAPKENADEQETPAAYPRGQIDNICHFAHKQCATERWGVKIGMDDRVDRVHLADVSPTILDLRQESAPGPRVPCTPRYPQEEDILELRDVRLVCFKWEKGSDGDRDFHLVLEDPSDDVVSPEQDPTCKLIDPKYHPDISQYRTIIVEIPDPDCLEASNPWRDPIAAVRVTFAAEFSPSAKPKRVNKIVSVRGVRFFDVPHGQLGVVQANAVELHPVLSFCVGRGCSLP
jgi:hypothetical protein